MPPWPSTARKTASPDGGESEYVRSAARAPVVPDANGIDASRPMQLVEKPSLTALGERRVSD
ncbi:hypothetical protein, partial [Bradyrhizobium sp.]|uniref:hypothetical protein n=1 Tax=Bradyrhizobium sp. TaxID=376 RepID=UPI003C396EA5